jgi:hypothetical protein
MTIAPPEPTSPDEETPDRGPSPDLPDPAFPEVLPEAEPGDDPDRAPATQPGEAGE